MQCSAAQCLPAHCSAAQRSVAQCSRCPSHSPAHRRMRDERVDFTGKELETYVGRGGCSAFPPGWECKLCWGCNVRSSGSRRSGRFHRTCVMGVRSKRPIAAKAAREAPGAGAPAVASTIAAALGLDAAAACASRPLLADAFCASDRCLLRFVICRAQASWKHKCFGNDC